MHLLMTILRSAVTVLLFVLFVILCVWAWSDRRREEFAAAARLPFDEQEHDAQKREKAH